MTATGIDSLPSDWRAWFEERAAIREYDGEQPREEAERAALADTRRAMARAGVVGRQADLFGRGRR